MQRARVVPQCHTRSMFPYYPARTRVDLNAIGANLRTVSEMAGTPHMCAIVKANAYGHGRAQVARAALRAGADFLGVAQVGEALLLREEIGAQARILTWIFGKDFPLEQVLAADLDLSIGAAWVLDVLEAQLADVAARLGVSHRLRVHIKVDTGMARGGFCPADVSGVAARLKALELRGLVQVVGLFSHLACADDPESDVTAHQIATFEAARAACRRAGLEIEIHHLGASSGTLWHEASRYDMVRPGAALYGISPDYPRYSARDLGLYAAMELSADLIAERTLESGVGISYGHRYHTRASERVGVIPLGYADGIDRKASNTAHVWVAGNLEPIRGTVCMDQCVISLPEGVEPGERVILFGDERKGYPTADMWAEATGTIGWEVLARLGERVPRFYYGDGTGQPGLDA